MRLNWRDWVATLCVVVAVALYGVWLAGAILKGGSGVKVVAGTVLALGVIASAFAVVPGFGQLMGGSKPYLAIATLLGIGALVAGIVTLLNGEEVMLAILVVATIALWIIATVRHVRASRGAVEPASAERFAEGMRKAA